VLRGCGARRGRLRFPPGGACFVSVACGGAAERRADRAERLSLAPRSGACCWTRRVDVGAGSLLAAASHCPVDRRGRARSLHSVDRIGRLPTLDVHLPFGSVDRRGAATGQAPRRRARALALRRRGGLGTVGVETGRTARLSLAPLSVRTDRRRRRPAIRTGPIHAREWLEAPRRSPPRGTDAAGSTAAGACGDAQVRTGGAR